VPGTCFVAMSFDPSLASAYDQGLCAAIEQDCGMKATRVDREHFGEKICDHILTEIRRAQFVVADATQQKPGAYFEAGFAMALGRDVIWTCEEDDFPNRHFDTRQYPHIKWKAPVDLRQQLADAIRARIPGAKLG